MRRLKMENITDITFGVRVWDNGNAEDDEYVFKAESRGDAEKLFTKLFQKFDNVQLIQTTTNVLKNN